MTNKPFADAQDIAPVLQGRGHSLDISVPRIMAILNVTPDSFFDGGRFLKQDDAIKQALKLVGEGADIIDVGGESTRPGAQAVSDQEEMERVIPVLEALHREVDIPLSVDTYKSRVAAAALTAGASFINDISGLQFDERMLEVVSSARAGLFLMHTRGRPWEMQNDTRYDDVLEELKCFFSRQLEKAFSGGISRKRIAIDPGIGFGKGTEGNLKVLHGLESLQSLGVPVLLGTSRKSFVGKILDKSDAQERLYGSLATIALGVQAGARIFRVHDVAASRDAALTAWAICSQGSREKPYLSGGKP